MFNEECLTGKTSYKRKQQKKTDLKLEEKGNFEANTKMVATFAAVGLKEDVVLMSDYTPMIEII